MNRSRFFLVPLLRGIPVIQYSYRQIPCLKVHSCVSLATDLFLRRRFLGAHYCDSAKENAAAYEKACEETLETLFEYFEEFVESNPHLVDTDVSYSDGVLTVNLGPQFGSYVINRQSPNQQIWLSSPFSGPKRYDFISKGNGYWLYKHDGRTLHELLEEELSKIIKTKVDFSGCSHRKI